MACYVAPLLRPPLRPPLTLTLTLTLTPPLTCRLSASPDAVPLRKACLMSGSLLRAMSPILELSTGTSRQHSTCRPHSLASAANWASQSALLCRSVKQMPVA